MKSTKKQQLLYSTILNKIYTRHTISRIDIARETGITPATVSLITAEMLSDHLIQEVGEEIDLQDKVGRKKILLSIAPEHLYRCRNIRKILFFCSDRQYRNRIPTGYFFSQPTQTNKCRFFYATSFRFYKKSLTQTADSCDWNRNSGTLYQIKQPCDFNKQCVLERFQPHRN